MTVLGKNDITYFLNHGHLGVDLPSGEEPSIEPASMDLHLAEETKHVESVGSKPVRVDDESTYPEYRTERSEYPTVEAGEFVLATTTERVQIPREMVALLHGRSSVGRLGLFIENAGLIDPGFSGQITLELTNVAEYDIDLKAGMRIGQLTFHRVENAPPVGYSKRNGNKYDGQSGPTPSRLYEDFN